MAITRPVPTFPFTIIGDAQINTSIEFEKANEIRATHARFQDYLAGGEQSKYTNMLPFKLNISRKLLCPFSVHCCTSGTSTKCIPNTHRMPTSLLIMQLCWTELADDRFQLKVVKIICNEKCRFQCMMCVLYMYRQAVSVPKIYLCMEHLCSSSSYYSARMHQVYIMWCDRQCINVMSSNRHDITHYHYVVSCWQVALLPPIQRYRRGIIGRSADAAMYLSSLFLLIHRQLIM